LHRRAARHVGRGAHHITRWLGSFAAVLILAALFAIWRLMQGPIELDWLTPYVEAAFDRAGVGFNVKVSGVSLGIDRGSHQLDLHAEDVRLSLPDGKPLARFPETGTSFSLGEMLHGQLAPTQMVIEHPILHLVRDASGTMTAQIGLNDTPPTDTPPSDTPPTGAASADVPSAGASSGRMSPRDADASTVQQVFDHLAKLGEHGELLGSLRHISIRSATVVVDDQRVNRTWRAERVDIAAWRDAAGISGDASLAVPMRNGTPELHASYRYETADQAIDLNLAVDGVQPIDIPPLVPELAELRHIEAPVSGTVQTRIKLVPRQLEGFRIDLSLGKGQVRSDWLPTGSVAVEKGDLSAVYQPENGEIRLEKTEFDLGGGAHLAVDGGVTGVTPELISGLAGTLPPKHLDGKLNVSLKNVPVDRFDSLWPKSLSKGGRKWTVANVHDGTLDEAAAHLDLVIDPSAYVADVQNAQGSMRYHDLTVNYFNGLPPVRNVSGTANFVGQHLDFMPTSGTLKGLKITGGIVQVSHLGERVEWLTVDLGLSGPLRDALDVIDAKPLHYAHAIGIDPMQVGGRADTQLHFEFPLLADLKFDAVDYSAKATLVGASIEKAMLGRNLSDGNLALDLNHTGAHLQGAVKFDGIATKVDANVPFNPKSGTPHAVYKVALMLDDEARRRLDFDVAPDRLSGPIGMEATYRSFASDRGEAVATLDLHGATLSLPEANWQKPADQPASAKVTLDLDKDGITKIPQIDVKGSDLDGRFAVSLSSDHKAIDQVDIRRLTVGESDISGKVVRREGGGWRAEIRAARIDARHLLKDATDSGAAKTPPSPPLVVNARIDRLLLGPQRELQGVSADLMRTGGIWQSGRINGHFANGHDLSLRFGEGDRRLVFQSDDLGATLRLLDIADNVAGGRISVNGQFSDTDGKRTLRAHIEGRGYTVERASLMARILTLPSLTGLASMLSGSGIPFSTLRGDVVFADNRLTLERLLAAGESLGITANGWIDIGRDQLGLQGTLAPAYALNSILDNVPIVGQLLGGGSQGLFAANFRLSGPSANPQVSVNPLSALTPGILRQIFSPIVGLPSAEPPPAQAPAPPPPQQAAH
jgi:hypothetical protein